MNIEGIANSIKTFLYDCIAVMLPGLALVICLLVFRVHPGQPDLALTALSGPQWILAATAVYILGTMVNAGGSVERRVMDFAARLTKRQPPKPRESPIKAALRAEIAARYGVKVDDLSEQDFFGMCYTLAGASASPHDKYLALKDMMRSLGFVTTVGLALGLFCFIHGGWHVALNLSLLSLMGLKPVLQANLAPLGCVNSVLLLLGLAAGKLLLLERERRLMSVCYDVIYPIALIAIKNASESQSLSGGRVFAATRRKTT